MWTAEKKFDATLRGPIGRGVLRTDSRVIERDGWYQIITPSASRGTLNEVLISQVDDDDAERVIDDVVREYRALGQSTKWCVGPWTRPADFGERLARRGFKSWDVRGMVRETTVDDAVPADVEAFEIDEASVPQYVAIMLRAWSMPLDRAESDVVALRTAIRETPRIVHLFVAKQGDAWLGTAGLILRDGYGYFIGASVFEAARGRGMYRALIAARTAFLRAHGFSLAVTQARAETSAPILERMGFETVFRSKCFLLE